MAKISPFKFLQEVRAEAQKVTWPTRKETTVTTIMVFVMVAIACDLFPGCGSDHADSALASCSASTLECFPLTAFENS